MKNLLLFVLILSIAACNMFNKETAVQYNNKIISVQDNIHLKLKTLGVAFATRDSVVMTASLESLKKTIDSGITVMNGIKDFEGSTALKDATLNLFKFYKRTAENEFTQEVNILKKQEISDEDQDLIAGIDEKISAEEKPLDEALAEAQKFMAEKYKFNLDKTE